MLYPYNKINELIIEGLSGASRAYLALRRKEKGLIAKHRSEWDEDRRNNGPLYLNDEPITQARFKALKPIGDKVRNIGRKVSAVRDAVPRKQKRENAFIRKSTKRDSELTHSHTNKFGKEMMSGFRKSLAGRIKAVRKMKRPSNKISEALSGASRAALGTNRKYKKLLPTLRSIDFDTSPIYQPDAVDAVLKSNKLRDKFDKQKELIPTKKTRNKQRIKNILSKSVKRSNRKIHPFRRERDSSARQIRRLRSKGD